jgi:hypothetical protein
MNVSFSIARANRLVWELRNSISPINPTSKKEVLWYFAHIETLCNAPGKQLLVMLWLWLAFVASLFHQKEKKNLVTH